MSEYNIYIEIGQKIRELRLANGLSQERMAAGLNVASNTISRWETGTYKTTPEDLDKLARYFNVSITVFFPHLESDLGRLSALTSATGGLNESDFEEVVRYAEFRKARRALEDAKAPKRRKGKGQMSRNEYFESLKHLAREKRSLHRVETATLGLKAVREIYKRETIRLDQWNLPRKVKAIYMCDCNDCSVAIQRHLPDEPKIFALIHELKHHYCDQDAIGAGAVHCGDYDANELIEKGAEVFAAEFIYPEEDFASDLLRFNVTTWRAEDVVNLKRDCPAKVSYMFLCKRLERLRLISPNQFSGIRFKKLEEEMFGIPIYRRRRA